MFCCCSPRHLKASILRYSTHDFSPNPIKVWRLVTNFLFFGEHFTLDFIFHVFFLVRYCRLLEEGEFRRSTADFIFFVIFGAVFMLAVAPLIPLMFLGSSLVFMMVRWFIHQNHPFLSLWHYIIPFLINVVVI